MSEIPELFGGSAGQESKGPGSGQCGAPIRRPHTEPQGAVRGGWTAWRGCRRISVGRLLGNGECRCLGLLLREIASSRFKCMLAIAVSELYDWLFPQSLLGILFTGYNTYTCIDVGSAMIVSDTSIKAKQALIRVFFNPICLRIGSWISGAFSQALACDPVLALNARLPNVSSIKNEVNFVTTDS